MKAVIAGLILSLVLAAHLATTYGLSQAALFVVGLAAGVILYHAAFGFTWAWREFVTTRRGAGLRAQMVMLGVTVAVFLPLLAAGQLGDQPLRGAIAPLGRLIQTPSPPRHRPGGSPSAATAPARAAGAPP